jgi:hypothetical protein
VKLLTKISFLFLFICPAEVLADLYPNKDIEANPDYLEVPNLSFEERESRAIQALDNARGQIGLLPISYPKNFLSYSINEKLLFLINTERRDRGLSEVKGIDYKLSAGSSIFAYDFAKCGRFVDPHLSACLNKPHIRFIELLSGNYPEFGNYNYKFAYENTNKWAEDIFYNPSIIGGFYEWVYRDAGSNFLHRKSILDSYSENAYIGLAHAISTRPEYNLSNTPSYIVYLHFFDYSSAPLKESLEQKPLNLNILLNIMGKIKDHLNNFKYF